MKVLLFEGGPVMTNAFVMADDAGRAFVLDPGFEPDGIAAEIEERGWQVELIVCTHGHFDHVAGNRRAKELWAVPLAMHAEAVPVATSAAEHALWFGIECESSPPPDRLLAHGDVVTVGRLELTVRHTPGHSPGGICLVQPGRAFVGDTLFAGSVGRTDLPHSDHDLLMRSIREQLMTLPDETVVYPGHGPCTRIGAERRTNPFRHEFGAAA